MQDRELDNLIAEHVMRFKKSGLTDLPFIIGDYDFGKVMEAPRYTTDPKAAQNVIDVMAKSNFKYEEVNGTVTFFRSGDQKKGCSSSKPLSLAIVEAALRAIDIPNV